ncbi:MAG TPA: site-2 protease family protein, partial [Humisphaera sp.]|nr:site-2 protease family protein [Humisphaera sp.]
MHPSILALSTTVQHIGMGTLLVLGFGFVIFWHELGHFLAAKWVGIKVEQFAVGFGQAVFSWRKGIGFRPGNTQRDYKEKIDQYLARSKKAQLANGGTVEYSDREISQAAAELGLGDTEYRLNWIPLGGYVKMLGQDDLRPDAAADDPRAYNRKSVSARMLVISAGVIMNVILAAIMFVVVFLMGLNAQPPQVGVIVAQSPAQQAGIKVGDTIVRLDGSEEQDFTKITLDVALAKADTAIPITVRRTIDGVPHLLDLQITPRKPDSGRGFVETGIGAPSSLRAVSKEDVEPQEWAKPGIDFPADALLVSDRAVIVKINGQSVSEDNYAALDRATQNFGQPIELTIKGADGKEQQGVAYPHFSAFFSGPFNLAGMEPRAQISQLTEDSSARGKLQTGDAVVSMTPAKGTALTNPPIDKLMESLKKIAGSGDAFSITVLRGDQTVTFNDLHATAAVGDQRGQKGLGVTLASDEQHPVLANVIADSAAAKAGLQAGDGIKAIGDQPVRSWFDVHRLLASAAPDAEIKVAYQRGEQSLSTTLKLDPRTLQAVQNIRYHNDLALLAPLDIKRQAPNALIAVRWGVIETRDFILQFYVTIRRMFEGSVALSNMMGPVGIFRGGMKFAFKGTDWLIWFLAMISANLAVVNFLPIPVVDGG